VHLIYLFIITSADLTF